MLTYIHWRFLHRQTTRDNLLPTYISFQLLHFHKSNASNNVYWWVGNIKHLFIILLDKSCVFANEKVNLSHLWSGCSLVKISVYFSPLSVQTLSSAALEIRKNIYCFHFKNSLVLNWNWRLKFFQVTFFIICLQNSNVRH